MQLTQTKAAGFTLIELIIIVTVLGILTAIVFTSDSGYVPRANDSERKNDTQTIVSEIERAYRANAVAAGPSYPPTSVGAAGLANIVENQDAITAPRNDANSLAMAANSTVPQAPTINQYIYQPFNKDGGLCTAAPCVRFILYYRQEVSPGSVVQIHSMRQQ